MDRERWFTQAVLDMSVDQSVQPKRVNQNGVRNAVVSAANAAQQAVEDRRPHLVVTSPSFLSPVVDYHGLARLHPLRPRFLMRPLLNGGTLGRRE